jgi:hypothetical protein
MTEIPGPASYLSETIEKSMLESLRNIVNDAKRSLIDFAEVEEKHYRDNAQLMEFFQKYRKRVHNDVSQIEYKIQSIITMAKNGGEIQRFGRSEAQRAAAVAERKAS